MIKKVLVINGGGRPNGNTAKLVQSFIKGVKDAGHFVDEISLVKNEVKPCLGCFACQTGIPCVQKDSFNSMVPKIKESDLLVFASPTYYFDMNARIKAFIERLFSVENKFFKGKDPNVPTKDVAMLVTAADGSAWNFQTMQMFYKTCFLDWLKFNDKGMLLAGGIEETIDKTDFLEKAYSFGKNIY